MPIGHYINRIVTRLPDPALRDIPTDTLMASVRRQEGAPPSPLQALFLERARAELQRREVA